MKIYLRNLWEAVQTSFWFVPAVMLALAVGLASGALAVDETLDVEYVQGFYWVYDSKPEGARQLLSTVAGSMIAVAGVVFSITIVTLTLASTQFGPRLLRNFMRDPGNKVVLGTFTSTFLYCLLVLRRIHGGEDAAFVPHLAVALGVLLAVVSIAVLIYYIHHVASSIQAENVISAVSADLHAVIDRLFPDPLEAEAATDDAAPLRAAPADFLARAAAVAVSASGYIQAIDQERLVRIARRHDLVVYLHCRPGRYLVAGAPLAQVWPASHVNPPLAKAINDAFILGVQPTPEQDVEFAIRQLVEVAVRALSPGVNDPFTAITCIDNLARGLGLLFGRACPSPLHRDADGQLRLITQPVTVADIVDAAFNQIRQYGSASVGVCIRLLESIAMLGPLARRAADRRALARHAVMIAEECRRQTRQPRDREDLMERRRAALQALGLADAEDFAEVADDARLG
ncbi:MAG: DUF2254 domain-containing protein [Pseudomonadota bacterium]|nr:DUF2254 domain-containing protein [Pseudomonadota bacterium]